MKYAKLTVHEFLKGVRSGRLELTDFYRELFPVLKALQKDYNFFVTLAEKEAFDQLICPKKGLTPGLPVSVKDCICTEGIQSTAGSRILEGYVPPFDATAVARLKHEGGVIVGKTQQDEFGFGTFSTNSGFGVPRNPIDPKRSCGGSSGGAAGLTRALEAPHIALAESTGGSISCPASFCGVVGLTPTYGTVSRWGLIDYANSLDKIGVMTRAVDDAALGLQVIQGFDTMDFTSATTLDQDYSTPDSVKGMRIGVPKEYLAHAQDDVRKQVMDALGFLEQQGAVCRNVTLPHTAYALPAYYVIAAAEASTNLARYCGMRYGASPKPEGNFNDFFSRVRADYLGEEAKRRVLMGTFARMAGYRGKYYLKAFQARSLVIQDFEKVFRGKRAVDVLIAPTMPCIAPTFSEIAQLSSLEQYQMDALTVGPNLAGIPQLSVPWGSVRGMPVGVHLLGDHLQERKILAAGRALEAGNREVEMG